MLTKFILNQLLKIMSKAPKIKSARDLVHQKNNHAGTFTMGEKSLPPFRLLFLGDSIAAGVGIPSFEESVVGRITKKLAGRYHVTCQNNAKMGSLAKDIGAQLEGTDWDLIVIITGSNDCLYSNPPKYFARDLNLVLEKISPEARKVIVVGPGDVASAKLLPAWARFFLKRRQQRFAKAIGKTVSNFANVVWANPLLTKNLPEYFDADDMHPNVLGHEVWFKIIEPYLYD